MPRERNTLHNIRKLVKEGVPRILIRYKTGTICEMGGGYGHGHRAVHIERAAGHTTDRAGNACRSAGNTKTVWKSLKKT